jgi:hypothetical protein
LAEQGTLNPKVHGSSPCAGTTPNLHRVSYSESVPTFDLQPVVTGLVRKLTELVIVIVIAAGAMALSSPAA